MAVISEVNSEAEVQEKLLPLLADRETSDFIFDLLSMIKIPDCFVPVYIYWLQKYKEENQLNKVGICERKIKEVITGKTITI